MRETLLGLRIIFMYRDLIPVPRLLQVFLDTETVFIKPAEVAAVFASVLAAIAASYAVLTLLAVGT